MNRETAAPHAGSTSGEKARKWVAYHHERTASSTYVYSFVWDITVKPEGPFCTDIDDDVLLDFTSHVAAAPLGCNDPKLMNRMAEFDLVDPTRITGQDSHVSGGSAPGEERPPNPAALVDRLTDLTSHYGMDAVFLSNFGAEAIENAIRIAHDRADGAKYGVTFGGAFHGRTPGALSLNCPKSVYRHRFPEISGVPDVPFYDDRACSPETRSCGFFPDTDSAVSKLRQKLHPKKGHISTDEVAYAIVEPIQDEDGYRFPSDAFVEELTAVVDDCDLTLIVDEIQTGVDRTGELWGSDHHPLGPDIITGAKDLHVGAAISNGGIFPDETSWLSSTWGTGGIVSSMQGVFTFGAIKEYDLLDNAVARGRQFIGQMRDDTPDTVVDVHGKDLLFTVELDTKEHRDAVQEAALKRGLLTLSCDYKVPRILLPLDVTARKIDLDATMLLGAIEDVP